MSDLIAPKLWTTAEVKELKRLRAQNKSTREIGRLMNRSRNSVHNKLQRIGLITPRGQRLPKIARKRPLQKGRIAFCNECGQSYLKGSTHPWCVPCREATDVIYDERIPRREVIHNHMAGDPYNRKDAIKKLSQIPDDTRDLTARMFGDPLPGRRALDRFVSNS